MNAIRKSLLTLRGAASFIDLMRHPDHLDQVFTLADSLSAANPKFLESLRDGFAQDPVGARALADKPRVGAIDMAALLRLPAGTLGRVYAEHMTKNRLDPSAIPSRPSTTDIEYVRAHLFESHDIWHAVTGFDADFAGEGGLQAFYLAQFPARLSAAILALGILNTLFYAFDERDVRMRAFVRGWLLGKRAKKFFGVDWKALWATPIDEVRAALGVDIAGVEAALPSLETARAGADAAAIAA